MNEDEYRRRIMDSEDLINEQLECDRVAHWKRFKNTFGIVISYSDWLYYNDIYADIVRNAKERMRSEADAIEKQFYDELEEEE